MPPKRRAASASSLPKKRKSARRKQATVEDEIPEVFQEMLAEAVASSSTITVQEPYIGRRKASEDPDSGLEAIEETLVPREPSPPPLGLQQKPAQIVYDDFEDSDDGDAEFEDVDLDAIEPVDDQREQQPLRLDLSAPTTTPKRLVRKQLASGAERRLRLDVHKAHLLLLLSALQHRNQWCENEQVQAILKPLVPRKIINQIHADDSKPQSERSYSFLKGIEAICVLWRTSWTVTARGMRRSHWRDDISIEAELDELEDNIDLEAFISAAGDRSGSRDLGAQLFCALLRSVAIEARLVCSLQVLPFSAVAKGQTPEKPKAKYAYAPAQDFGSSTASRPNSKIAESAYPIYWVEVFSPSSSTWIPLDPLVRNTINKPRSGFEPPASDTLNSLSYVIAFEDDGSAKDVTLRYTTHFNAKNRKSRVESTRGGEEWWSRVMNYFEKSLPEVRDELEDAEFLRRAEQEGMPKNVADFKGHPLYVLERHLRRNEVIHPRREVGKVTVGVGQNQKLESVFRRRDVHLCRTSDAWYRRGRDIREGMEPLKFAAPRTRLEKEEAAFDDEEDQSEGMALFAEYQTEVYVPPPVVDGQIPRNKFGNLDVYVESMIPAGGIHVQHPLAAKAAAVLGISFADAVTGFEFKGRQGTAVINGVVVSETQRIAMVTVIVGLQSQAIEEIENERSRITLVVWKKWLRALQIRDRLEQEYGEKGNGDQMASDEAEDENDSTYHEDEDAGGGFMPDPEITAAVTDPEPAVGSLGKAMVLPPLPSIPEYHEIVVVESPHKLSKPSRISTSSPAIRSTAIVHEGRGFIPDENGDVNASAATIDDAEMSGGGFMLDDEEEEGPIPKADFHVRGSGLKSGGFVVEDEDSHTTNARPAQTMPTPHSNHILVSSSTTQTAEHPKDEHQPLDNPTLDDQAPKDQQHPEEESDKDSLINSDTSMLSHDPEEEDAEPEWLLDSLG